MFFFTTTKNKQKEEIIAKVFNFFSKYFNLSLRLLAIISPETIISFSEEVCDQQTIIILNYYERVRLLPKSDQSSCQIKFSRT